MSEPCVLLVSRCSTFP